MCVTLIEIYIVMNKNVSQIYLTTKLYFAMYVYNALCWQTYIIPKQLTHDWTKHIKIINEILYTSNKDKLIKLSLKTRYL